MMLLTLEELCDGICRLGGEEPLDGVRIDTWRQLGELGMVQRGPNGDPLLTERGEEVYPAIEAGDSIPEFDREPI